MAWQALVGKFFCGKLYYPDDDITTRQPHTERARKHDTTTTAKATVVLQLVGDDHLGHSYRDTGDGDTPSSSSGVANSQGQQDCCSWHFCVYSNRKGTAWTYINTISWCALLYL